MAQSGGTDQKDVKQEFKKLLPIESKDLAAKCKHEDKLFQDYLNTHGTELCTAKIFKFFAEFKKEVLVVTRENEKIAQQDPTFSALATMGTVMTAADVIIKIFASKQDAMVQDLLSKGSFIAALYLGYRQYVNKRKKTDAAILILQVFKHLTGDTTEEKWKNVIRALAFRFRNFIETLDQASIARFARYFVKNICYNLVNGKIDFIDQQPIIEFLYTAAMHFDREDHASPLYEKTSRLLHTPVAKTLKFDPGIANNRTGNPTILGVIANSPCLNALGQIMVSAKKLEEAKQKPAKIFKYPIGQYEPTLLALHRGRTNYKFFHYPSTDESKKDQATWLKQNAISPQDNESLEDFQKRLITILTRR